MKRIKRSRYSFKQVLAHWEDVVHRLCDEVTPHDVLEVVKDYLELVSNDIQAFNLNNSRFNKAKELVTLAMNEINPTQD